MHIEVEVCSQFSFFFFLIDVSDKWELKSYLGLYIQSVFLFVLKWHFILSAKAWKLLVLQLQTLVHLFKESCNVFVNMMLTFESVSDKEVQRNPETRKWGLWIMEYCISHLFYDSFVLSWFGFFFFPRLWINGVGKSMSAWGFCRAVKYKLKWFCTSWSVYNSY